MKNDSFHFAGSDGVRRSQYRCLLPFGPPGIPSGRQRCTPNALGTGDPAQGALFFAHRLTEHGQTVHEGHGTWRAARHINIYREKFIHALDNAVNIVHAAGVGARSHGNDPPRHHHLLVETLDNRRHLYKRRARNDHEIRFPWRTPNHLCAESCDIISAGNAGGHFNIAARKTEIKRPNGVFPTPGNQILQFG